MLSHPLEIELLSLSSPDPLVAEAEAKVSASAAAAADDEAHASYMACLGDWNYLNSIYLLHIFQYLLY